MKSSYRIYFIYKTTNLINGKIYVGQHSTYNIDDGYLGSGSLLKEAIENFGYSNFKLEILEKCMKKIINEREIYWIKKMKSTDPDIGYNLNRGGSNPYINKRLNKELLILKNNNVYKTKKLLKETRNIIKDRNRKRDNQFS